MGGRRRRHEWVIVPPGHDQRAAHAPRAGAWRDVDAHRNHRGPYTAAGELVRRLARDVRTRAPDLVATHQLTLLSVAPELWDRLPASSGLTRAFTFSREGNPRAWTRWIANGLTDFVLGYVARTARTPRSIAFVHVDHADPSDQEFLGMLLGRADPARLLLRVFTSSDALDDRLLTPLRAHARRIPRDGRAPRHGPTRRRTSIRRALAAEYVRSDCTSDRADTKAAYDALREADWRALHAARAAVLEARGEPSLALGAIPFHHERGSADAAPLAAAAAACMQMAYYDAALDWAVRGRRLIAPPADVALYGELTRHMLFALLLLGRFDEVEALGDECLSESRDPSLLAHVAYAKAILQARYYEPARRDYDAAARWIEAGQAFTARVPPSAARAVNLAFLENTMALVEMRKGRHAAAITRLSAALEALARDAPDRYGMECEILFHNRARLHLAVHQIDQAIGDFTALLRHEPSNSVAHLDRGLLRQRTGQLDEALRDYDDAIAWSPPYEEPHFNRGLVLEALGREDEALAEFDYVLVLNPDFVDALIQRGRLRHARHDLAGAQADAARARAVAPANARARCLGGLVEMASGDLGAARRSFGAALDADPSLPDAWANRATIRFKQGQPHAALEDLSRAVRLRADADVLYNRGRVLESLERWQDAIDDYTRALAQARADVPLITRRLAVCRRAMGAAGTGDPPARLR